MDLLGDACAAHEPYACGALGRELLAGRFVQADPERGTLLLRQACLGGADAACLAAGMR
jgi:TPR repeat protein